LGRPILLETTLAKDENDVTDGALDGETRNTQRARQRALGENPLSADQMADAIAKAHLRVREDELKAKERPLPDIVRASVRCGTEQVHDPVRNKITVRPAKLTFGPSETGDGTTATVEHGRPVRLKRAAFLHYQSLGLVVAG